MHKFRYAKVWLTLGWLLVAVIVFLSLMPKPPQPLEFEQSDKLYHVIVYMTLMLWFANIYPQRSSQLQLSLGFFVMGVCLELLQGMTEYRTFSYTDLLANGIGISLALYLAKTRLATYLLRLDTWLTPPF
jgi:VanZ family protein